MISNEKLDSVFESCCDCIYMEERNGQGAQICGFDSYRLGGCPYTSLDGKKFCKNYKKGGFDECPNLIDEGDK